MAGETEGFVKIVADKKYDEVLGVHMIGLRSTELVAEATLALRLESTVEELIRTIHAHPTMAEAVGEDTDYLLVSNPQSGELTIIDIDTHSVVAIVAVGREPGYIAVTPDRQYALVLNRASGDMAVIRIAAIAAKRSKSAPLFTMIPVGSKPVAAAVRAV
jgi:YVTN family beta-propeller protein